MLNPGQETQDTPSSTCSRGPHLKGIRIVADFAMETGNDSMPCDLQVQWGLNLRPKAAAEAAPAAEEAVNGAPNTRDWELAKFKADMERLPGVSP